MNKKKWKWEKTGPTLKLKEADVHKLLFGLATTILIVEPVERSAFAAGRSKKCCHALSPNSSLLVDWLTNNNKIKWIEKNSIKKKMRTINFLFLFCSNLLLRSETLIASASIQTKCLAQSFGALCQDCESEYSRTPGFISFHSNGRKKK